MSRMNLVSYPSSPRFTFWNGQKFLGFEKLCAWLYFSHYVCEASHIELVSINLHLLYKNPQLESSVSINCNCTLVIVRFQPSIRTIHSLIFGIT